MTVFKLMRHLLCLYSVFKELTWPLTYWDLIYCYTGQCLQHDPSLEQQRVWDCVQTDILNIKTIESGVFFGLFSVKSETYCLKIQTIKHKSNLSRLSKYAN